MFNYEKKIEGNNSTPDTAHGKVIAMEELVCKRWNFVPVRDAIAQLFQRVKEYSLIRSSQSKTRRHCCCWTGVRHRISHLFKIKISSVNYWNPILKFQQMTWIALYITQNFVFLVVNWQKQMGESKRVVHSSVVISTPRGAVTESCREFQDPVQKTGEYLKELQPINYIGFVNFVQKESRIYVDCMH